MGCLDLNGPNGPNGMRISESANQRASDDLIRSRVPPSHRPLLQTRPKPRLQPRCNELRYGVEALAGSIESTMWSGSRR